MALLAVELVKRGKSVQLFSLEKAGPLCEMLESSGVRVVDGGYRSTAPPWMKVLMLVRAQFRLCVLALTWKPQVIHGFLPLTNLMAALAGRFARVRRVITSRRALGLHQERRPGWARFDRLANRLSTVITANSQAVAADVVKRDQVDPAKIECIYNGIEFLRDERADTDRAALRKSIGLSDTDIAIVSVANLIPYKGHKELIEAVARLSPDWPHIKLVLIGEDRGIGAELDALSKRLGIDEQIVRLGRREDVASLLGAMDIGVMASHEEGFSNALLEKLAAGLPVVATSVGGNPEALEGMPGCMLVSPRNANDLMRGLQHVLQQQPDHQGTNDSQYRRKRVLERFSVESMVASYERIYG
ncbi:D-inositol-3-phosphate glycosyltransferase [Paraburkholderia solisilvae]|uniref:D-inositol-3-phosphate glycosyltransferase n=2 Tax=Paraburkholderia solisilvae TaxID=624376 RepID=A0A6J5E0S0_9BURK|nr:D-inositol-3-phosphate glycosyltransferase [Paraburkholderia solisilvae]